MDSFVSHLKSSSVFGKKPATQRRSTLFNKANEKHSEEKKVTYSSRLSRSRLSAIVSDYQTSSKEF